MTGLVSAARLHAHMVGHRPDVVSSSAPVMVSEVLMPIPACLARPFSANASGPQATASAHPDSLAMSYIPASGAKQVGQGAWGALTNQVDIHSTATCCMSKQICPPVAV